ncbi:MAG: hypothetical protein H6R00_4833, partial [Proteobacteria bacterium]|nr:hypothetical protein [Pseudomonadota bacterium]
QPPDYSISFDLWENGVSSKMRLDYGDFVLDGKIVHFEMLPETPCSAPPTSAEPSVALPPGTDKPAAEALPKAAGETEKVEQPKSDTPADTKAPAATDVKPGD